VAFEAAALANMLSYSEVGCTVVHRDCVDVVAGHAVAVSRIFVLTLPCTCQLCEYIQPLS